jgi:predicted Zn-dependent protease
MALDSRMAEVELSMALKEAVHLLKAGHAGRAEENVRAILARTPSEPNALFLLAKSRRSRGYPQEALATLDALRVRNPNWASVHLERALILQEQGDLRGAVAALREVARLEPRRASVWGLLVQLLTSLEDRSGADEALRGYLRAASRPGELVDIVALVQEGKLAKAEERCREYLRRAPIDVDAIRLLAEIATRLEIYEDAETLFERCLALMPDFDLARAGYANALMKLGKFDVALVETDRLLARSLDNPSYRILRASILVRVGRHEAAIEDYRSVTSRPGSHPRDFLSLGHALKTVGRRDEAIAAYRKAIALDPLFGDAYWSLANLKTFRFAPMEIEVMRAAEASGSCPSQEYPALCFALGKAYEDNCDFETSFHWYARGNERRRPQVRYEADNTHRATLEMIQCCATDIFCRNAGHGYPDASPIFIVGLPRSGSTLIEQILASHSLVDGTAELTEIINIAWHLSGRKLPGDRARYPAILQELQPDQLRDLGRRYIEQTRIQRHGAPYFIDKMPNNFSHLGLIHLILPNARIIDARRHPIATCLSSFKQLFAVGQNFSYDLSELGRYYVDYVRLMHHWETVMPNAILRVFHEDLVSDTETNVKRILSFCGLPFEENCMRFYETSRAIRTASSEQVRRPIYAEGVTQWRHFEPFLRSLHAELGDLLTGYPFP